MTFANPKEETINLELTSYGRYLLSLGQFKPHTYAFFDEDIIYDRQHLSGTTGNANVELQNNIEGRIQEETPRLKPQSLHRGAQVGTFSDNPEMINNLMPGVVADESKKGFSVVTTPESSYIFANPIGNSAFNSNNMPAWDLGFYKAPLKSANYAWTGSMNPMYTGSSVVPTTFIPQLECDINYQAHFYGSPKNAAGKQIKDIDKFVSKVEKVYSDYYTDDENYNEPIVLNDNSCVVLTDDCVLLKVEEANTEFTKDNFEIEVWEIESKGTGGKPDVLKKLYFSEKAPGVDEEKTIEYFFDIDIDFEIPEEFFCHYNSQKEKIKNIYSDRIFNCGKTKPGRFPAVDIYGTAENQDLIDATTDTCD